MLIAALFFGPSLAMLIIGVRCAYSTFPNKNEIFWLCVVGLVSATLETLLFSIQRLLSIYVLYPTAIFAEISIVSLYILNVKRIQSLGVAVTKYEGLVSYLPIAVLVVLLCHLLVYMAKETKSNLKVADLATSEVTWSLIFLADTYCFVVLLKKINIMLEIRPELQTILRTQIFISYAVSLFGDLTFFIFFISQCLSSISLLPLFLFRYCLLLIFMTG